METEKVDWWEIVVYLTVCITCFGAGFFIGLLSFRGEKTESKGIKCRTIVEVGVCNNNGTCRVDYDDGSRGRVDYPRVGDKTGDCEP